MKLPKSAKVYKKIVERFTITMDECDIDTFYRWWLDEATKEGFRITGRAPEGIIRHGPGKGRYRVTIEREIK